MSNQTSVISLKLHRLSRAGLSKDSFPTQLSNVSLTALSTNSKTCRVNLLFEMAGARTIKQSSVHIRK